MAARLRKLTTRPVSYVINTHWHDDHHGGNAVYRELWPDVRIVGRQETRRDIIEKTYRGPAEHVSDMLATAESHGAGRPPVKTMKDSRSRSGGGRARAKSRRSIARLRRKLRAIREAPPDVTFSDRLTLRSGERTIQSAGSDCGNTRGDTVVCCRARIAASGDLVVYPIPFMFGSYHEGWVKTLDALDGLPVDTLVPGHGPLFRDRTYLRQVRGLLQALVDRVKAAVAAGATLEQTQQQVTLQDWKTTMAGDDPRRHSAAFDGFVVQPAVERMWRQARGEAGQVGRSRRRRTQRPGRRRSGRGRRSGTTHSADAGSRDTSPARARPG